MKNWVQPQTAMKILAVLLLVVFLYAVSGALNFLLLTFIFTYLAFTAHKFLVRHSPKALKKHPKVILVALYSLIVVALVFVSYRYTPLAIKEIGNIVTQITSFNLEPYEEKMPSQVVDLINSLDMGFILKEVSGDVISATAGISTLLLEVLIALLLSFFFILEYEKITQFTRTLRTEKTQKIYDQFILFGNSFVNTFGKAIKVQLIISSINTVLSVIGLMILGFSNIIGLAVMIFLLGMIPVAGVMISLIPLSIMAFQIGGFMHIMYVLIMIAIIHALESYFLNPKLYSVTMKLPIFYSFMVLMVSELVLGIWGLIVGIPLFMFILELIKGSETEKVETIQE